MSAIDRDPRLVELRKHLLQHPLYASLRNADDVRFFMSYHVFCVWDFMSLLKALQRRLTCVEVPWRPPVDPRAARLVNEIVLAEESDEDGQNGHASHFELYLSAMQDTGASTWAIRRLLQLLDQGLPWRSALTESHVPPAVTAFVSNTLELATTGATHEIAAGFALGREDVIPAMFVQLLEQLASRDPVGFGRLHYYLSRHVEIDGDSHGPAARQLVERLCGDEASKIEQAVLASCRCLEARVRLWDAIQAQLPSQVPT
jgi:hypothetical protein